MYDSYLNVNIHYRRRNKKQGKKLRLIDSILILKRIWILALIQIRF